MVKQFKTHCSALDFEGKYIAEVEKTASDEANVSSGGKNLPKHVWTVRIAIVTFCENERFYVKVVEDSI